MMSQLDAQYRFRHDYHNINLLWGSLFIEELVRHGIEDFCIAPGSRSTPLTLAVAKHAKTTSHVHLDERGLGYLALGLSQASSKPVVIIITSGTAVANLYPAVIEAKQSHIPLIIISADRPTELINCMANQAIDQVNIFGGYPVFFSQLPAPSISLSSNALLTTIDQGLFQQRINQGPIHFNIAFNEPFYPQGETINFKHYLTSLKGWDLHHSPFTDYQQINQLVTNENKLDLAASKIIVVVGRIKDQKQAVAIQQFCQAFSLVLLADIQSQLQSSANNIVGYDLLLENKHFKQHLSQAELILQFSDHIVSKRLNQFIEHFSGNIWAISEHSQRIDPTHTVSKQFHCTPEQFTKNIINNQYIDSQWFLRFKQYESLFSPLKARYCQEEQLSEINCSTYLLNSTLSNVVLANSMAIRLADMFAQTNARIYSNRGASGIEGLIATAVGIAKNNHETTFLLIGDTSFLYDLNSLQLLTQSHKPLVIILLNNDGGGIFNLLPVPVEQQQKYYQLPHGLTFQKTCEQFSINYSQPTSFSEFKSEYAKASQQNKSTLIEVCTSNQLTATQLQVIKEQIQNATL
jgi:2-succinyl-5-enolpyruvyl-6-hydroxy-3-cyclohexene-1-carboxylate synthase